MDNYGVFADAKDTARANSLIVAQMFEKRHADVIRAIENITDQESGVTENIRLLHENQKPHHFSNECDMLNRVATGMTAKQFRIAHGIEKGESIRPHLTEVQIKMLDTLQKVDIGLLLAMPDYHQRKRQLEWYRDHVLGIGAIGA